MTPRRPTLDYTHDRWIRLLEIELAGLIAANTIRRLNCEHRPTKIDKTPIMKWKNPPPNFVRWTTKPRVAEPV